MVLRRRSRTVRVFFEAYGPGPWPCDYCGELVLEIKMGVGCVHHRNDVKLDDSPENLGTMHTACHVRHHRAGKPGNRRDAKMTEAQRQHLSSVLRGKPAAHGYTPEVRAKLSASLRGRPHVESQITCECGKICNAGPMKLHQRATSHVTINLLDHEETTT